MSNQSYTRRFLQVALGRQQISICLLQNSKITCMRHYAHLVTSIDVIHQIKLIILIWPLKIS